MRLPSKSLQSHLIPFYLWSYYKNQLRKTDRQSIPLTLKIIKMLWGVEELEISVLVPLFLQTPEPESYLSSLVQAGIIGIENEYIYLVDKPESRFGVFTYPFTGGMDRVPCAPVRHQPNPVMDICTEVLQAQSTIPFTIHPHTSTKIPYSLGYIPSERKNIQLTLDHLKGHTFYFNHYYDVRGRLYPHAYGVNYQGDDFHKACLVMQ